uniref:C2H2-type domain-containing protein n=1 Tax=Bionectria ochroleuca TaxID=29856 RepID=A0A8H7NAX3_BIOOC
MSKRIASSSALQEPPLKKLHLDVDIPSAYPDPSTARFTNLEIHDDDRTTAQTPSSMNDAESPVTAATTPAPNSPPTTRHWHAPGPGAPRPSICPYDDCGKDYTVDKHLKQHIKAVHTQERKHVCPREGCGKSFVTGTRLKRHQAVHEGEERFRCQDCGQSFRKRETLNKHVRKEHQNLAAYPCTEPDCTVAFDTKSSLKRHQQLRVKENEDGTESRVGFTTEVLLQAHLKREHQNCMFCDFKSTTQGELERHVEFYHSGKTVEDRKNKVCPYPDCGKKFTTQSNCNSHIRAAHEGQRFVCGEVELTSAGLEAWSTDQGCGDKFSTKARLEDHVRYVHLLQERPKLSAPVRDKPPPSPDAVFDYIAGIANIAKANITCPHCREAFIRYGDLDSHIEKYHARRSTSTDANDILGGDGQKLSDPSIFEQEFPSNWPEEMDQEEIFAAEMDYGPPQDDWAEDEANILLLARDTPDLDSRIDPALEAI